VGKLVLWSSDANLVKNDVAAVLNSANVKHVAIANPKLAPYGEAAYQTLKSLGLEKNSVWYLAGISGYLLVAWICLEPAWKRRILNLIIAVLLLRIFFLSPTPEAYNKFLPYLVVYTLLTASFSWLSIVRFKAGKQD